MNWEVGIDIYTLLGIDGASLVAQLVKNPPALWETSVRSLGWEDPLEKGKATHCSILAWSSRTVYWSSWNSMKYVVHGVTKSPVQV